MKQLLFITGLILLAGVISAQESLFRFGEEIGLQKIISGENMEGVPVHWIQVNTEAETGVKEEGSGTPTTWCALMEPSSFR